MEWTFLSSAADLKLFKDKGLVTDAGKVMKCLPWASWKVVRILEEEEIRRQFLARPTGDSGCAQRPYSTDLLEVRLQVSWSPDLLLKDGHSQGELGLWGIWMSRWHFGLFSTFSCLFCPFRDMLLIYQQVSTMWSATLDPVGNRKYKA